MQIECWSIFDAWQNPIGQSFEDGPARKSEGGAVGCGAAVCSRDRLKGDRSSGQSPQSV